MIAIVYEISYPNQTIIVAITVSLISPLILSFLTNRSRIKEKELDWKREDKKENEKALKAQEVADRLFASNEAVAANTKVTNGKLDVIHTLVNSNMTAAMKAELEATIEKLILMKQIVARDKADKITVLPEAILAIRNVESKITELQATLADRLKQTDIADKQIRG